MNFAEILAVKGNGNLNVRNKKGFAPLIKLVRDNKLDDVEKLINLGADVNFTDKKGLTSLHHAI